MLWTSTPSLSFLYLVLFFCLFAGICGILSKIMERFE